MKKTKLISIFTIISFFALTSFLSAPLWVNFVSPLTKYAALFPSQPQFSYGKHPVTRGKTGIATHKAPGKPAFTIIDVPTGHKITAPDKILNAEIDIFCKAKGIKIPGTYPKMRYEKIRKYNFKQIVLKKGGLEFTLRVAAKGFNVYSLYVEYAGTAPTSGINKFFTSFNPK